MFSSSISQSLAIVFLILFRLWLYKPCIVLRSIVCSFLTPFQLYQSEVLWLRVGIVGDSICPRNLFSVRHWCVFFTYRCQGVHNAVTIASILRVASFGVPRRAKTTTRYNNHVSFGLLRPFTCCPIKLNWLIYLIIITLLQKIFKIREITIWNN